MSNVIEGNLTVRGMVIPNSIRMPAGSVSDAAIAADAAIDPDKMIHRFRVPFHQPNTTATAETRVVFVARAAAEVVEFVAGSIAACIGAATITLDLKKNGTTILSAVITLDNANTARVVEAATLAVSPTPLVAGDVLEIVTTATAGGGTIGTGLFAAVTINENPS